MKNIYGCYYLQLKQRQFVWKKWKQMKNGVLVELCISAYVLITAKGYERTKTYLLVFSALHRIYMPLSYWDWLFEVCEQDIQLHSTSLLLWCGYAYGYSSFIVSFFYCAVCRWTGNWTVKCTLRICASGPYKGIYLYKVLGPTYCYCY